MTQCSITAHNTKRPQPKREFVIHLIKNWSSDI